MNNELDELNALKGQFRISLFETVLAITTEGNNHDSYEAKLNASKPITIGSHDWIETKVGALNYYECRGVLILFGIDPPTYKELCHILKIKHLKAAIK